MRTLALIAAFFSAAALAQLRTIPTDAERGVIHYVRQNVIELDGKHEILAPGARIRDASNRIIVPTALPESALVKYRRDRGGAVREVWILTPEETHR